MRLGAVNNSYDTVLVGEPLIPSNLPVFISPKIVPSIGDRVTVTTTTTVNIRSRAPQYPNYKLADQVGSVKPGQRLVIQRIESFRDPATSSPYIEVWAEVGLP